MYFGNDEAYEFFRCVNRDMSMRRAYKTIAMFDRNGVIYAAFGWNHVPASPVDICRPRLCNLFMLGRQRKASRAG